MAIAFVCGPYCMGPEGLTPVAYRFRDAAANDRTRTWYDSCGICPLMAKIGWIQVGCRRPRPAPDDPTRTHYHPTS